MTKITTQQLNIFLTQSIENATMMVPDCKTFIFSRGKNIEELRNNGCGGGNYLMALGLFSTIGFLASLYWICDGKNFNLPADKKEKNDVSAEIAFCKLIKDIPPTVANLGLPLSEAGQVWKYFRNKLAHIASPAQPIRTFTPKRPTTQFLSCVEADNRQAFVREDGVNWICEVDLLTFRVKQVKEWIIEKINKGDFKYENLTRALVWVQKDH